MVYNEQFSIYQDFNTKEVKIYDEHIHMFIQEIFDTYEDAKEYIKTHYDKK